MAYSAYRCGLSFSWLFGLMACGGHVSDDQGSGSDAQSERGGARPASSRVGTTVLGQGGLATGGTGMVTGGNITITTSTRIVGSCGNGVVNPGEECDDGNNVNGDGCSATCQIDSDWCKPECLVTVEICGNGRLTAAEVCDDGNTTDGDGCSSECSQQDGWFCPYAGKRCEPYCGDGLVVGSEACDRGADNGKYVAGVITGCSTLCRLVPACTLEGAPEACLDDCAPLASGELPSDCPGICGDSVIDWNEQCDDGELNSDTNYGGCTTQCHYGPFCGDGVRNGDEECDLGNSNRATYGIEGCTSSCNVSHYCGDGIIDSAFGEFCDLGPNPSLSQGCDSHCAPFIGP